MLKKSFIGAWIVASTFLFLYSFTQVDLSLTLSKISAWQTIQKYFQQIGYFNRPFSTYLFIAIIALLFTLYVWTLYLVRNNRLSRQTVWLVIVFMSVLLLFSYNAFSYDLFNYLFDARIITHYHQNPYYHKALDYPGDPMLSFMHSTHRTYPYGPAWLALTIPLSFVGGNIFLLTFYLFKALVISSYLGTSFFLEKILSLSKMKNALFGVVLFALNPLTIIESVVSAHNDIVMIFFAVVALYFLVKRNYLVALGLLFISIGIKFATIFLLPAFLFFLYLSIKKQNIHNEKFFLILFFLMVFAVALTSFASGQNKNPEIQPWYLLQILPFAALLSRFRAISFLIISISLGILFSYIPLLNFGQWPANIVSLKLYLMVVSGGAGLGIYFLTRIWRVVKKN